MVGSFLPFVQSNWRPGISCAPRKIADESDPPAISAHVHWCGALGCHVVLYPRAVIFLLFLFDFYTLFSLFFFGYILEFSYSLTSGLESNFPSIGGLTALFHKYQFKVHPREPRS